MTARRLMVAPQVAERLPAVHLAQMQAQIDDPDNRCGVCGGVIDGPVADVVLFCDGDYTAARVTHPACARSGIRELPGLRAGEIDRFAEGANITVVLGRRPGPSPRALVFIELIDSVSFPGPDSASFIEEDPVADYAELLGLHPISGQLTQIIAAPTTTSHLQLDQTNLTLIHPNGRDLLWDVDDDVLAGWRDAAAGDGGHALLITGRGLGLSRQPPTIARALVTQPVWGAQVDVDGLPRRGRRRWRPRRGR